MKVFSTLCSNSAIKYQKWFVCFFFLKMLCVVNFFPSLILNHINFVVKFPQKLLNRSPILWLFCFQSVYPLWHCYILSLVDCSPTPNSISFIGWNPLPIMKGPLTTLYFSVYLLHSVIKGKNNCLDSSSSFQQIAQSGL